MILVPQLKLAFMHVPKTGGSSITAALMEHLPDLGGEVGSLGWQCKFHRGYMHTPYSQLKWWNKPDGWRTFAVVREPFDRMHSYYVASGCATGFTEWLKLAPEDQRYQVMPQAAYLSKDSEVAMDVIVRYENLSEGLAELDIQLPEKRQLDNHRTREQMLAAYEAEPEAVDLVRSLSGRDFTEFGYSSVLECLQP